MWCLHDYQLVQIVFLIPADHAHRSYEMLLEDGICDLVLLP